MPNITSVTVGFGNGVKREEYGPVKKAEASVTACVAENEDGEAVLARIGELALAQVAALLDAPKPNIPQLPIEQKAVEAAQETAAGEAPPRRGRGRPKKEEATSEPAAEVAAEPLPEPVTEVNEQRVDTANDDGWETSPADIEVTDAELLSSLSRRAQELGNRDPCIKLIATFATRTDGPPFKVQEIPQAQRKDFLAKLAALTA